MGLRKRFPFQEALILRYVLTRVEMAWLVAGGALAGFVAGYFA